VTIVALLGGIRATCFAALAALLLTATGVQTARLHYAEGRLTHWVAEAAKQSAAAQMAARKAEQDKAQALAEVANQYEQDKAHAKAAADRTIADLRAGNLRLQDRWAGCVPGATPGAGQPDAAADDRAASAGRIVQAADDADAQIRGLQEALKADRK
jgi:hypothetical protein